jgi:Dihaem cytochrome c
MKKKKKFIWAAAVLLLTLSLGVAGFIFLERHDHEEKNHGRRLIFAQDKGHKQNQAPEHNRSEDRPRVVNETYKENCGGCHFAYPPDLLPASSWKDIVTRSGNHFGESLTLDDASRQEIGKYLKENAADRSRSKKAGKILRSLGGRSPSRITEIPYIVKEHREIVPEVFKRKSIGSLSNCIACHKAADQGQFDDDQVTIPQ